MNESDNCCDYVRLEVDKYVHENTCINYTGGIDANTVRQLLRGVELYMHTDVVLQHYPKEYHVATPRVISNEVNGNYDNLGLIIEWYYPEFTLRIERAKSVDGNAYVYVVVCIYLIDDVGG